MIFLHSLFNKNTGFKGIQANIVFLVVHFLTYYLSNQCKYCFFLLFLHLLFIRTSGFKGIHVDVILLTYHLSIQCKYWSFLWYERLRNSYYVTYFNTFSNNILIFSIVMYYDLKLELRSLLYHKKKINIYIEYLNDMLKLLHSHVYL